MRMKVHDAHEAEPLNNRSAWFDNMKCLLIICVVIGHLISGTNQQCAFMGVVYKFIYIFHMPAFLFLSGFFMKKRIQNREYGKSFTKLVIPYILISIVLAFVYTKIGRAWPGGTFTLLYPLYALWYILALIVYAFVTPTFVKCKYALPISFLCMFLVGLGTSNEYLTFQKTIAFYPYFLLGYYIPYKKIEFLKKKRYMALGILFFIGLAFFVYYLQNHIYVNTLTLGRPYGEHPNNLPATTAFFYRLCFVPLSILAIFAIIAVAPRKKHWYTYVGTNCVYVYLLHTIIIVLWRYFGVRYGIYERINSWYELIIYIALGVVLCFILASKYVRKWMRPLVQPHVDLSFLHKAPVAQEEETKKLRQEVEELKRVIAHLGNTEKEKRAQNGKAQWRGYCNTTVRLRLKRKRERTCR